MLYIHVFVPLHVCADHLGITDKLDRVKLLQEITTMQADLASLAPPVRRWRRGSGSSSKLHRLGESSPPTYYTLASRTSLNGGGRPVSTKTATLHRNRLSLPEGVHHNWVRSRANTLSYLPEVSSQTRLARSTQPDLRRATSPPEMARSKSDEKKDGIHLTPHFSHKRRLSKSVDKLEEVNLTSHFIIRLIIFS